MVILCQWRWQQWKRGFCALHSLIRSKRLAERSICMCFEKIVSVVKSTAAIVLRTSSTNSNWWLQLTLVHDHRRSVCLWIYSLTAFGMPSWHVLRDRSIYLSTYSYLSIYLPIYLSIYLPIYLSIYLSIYTSTHSPIHPSIHPSVRPSVHPMIYPSAQENLLLTHVSFTCEGRRIHKNTLGSML